MDIAKLTAPISPEAPCGENLEYDPLFMEVDRELAGKPEQQVGKSVLEGVDPDWKRIQQGSLELLGRTRDLRIAMFLTVGATKTRGLLGFRDGLKVVHAYVEQFWDKVYPQLDPDDRNDPTARLNVLGALAANPLTSDNRSLPRHLREAPLTESRQLGRHSLRSIQMAEGEFKPTGDEKAPSKAEIAGAFADTDLASLKALGEAATNSRELLTSLEKLLDTKLGAAQSIRLDGGRKLIGEIEKRVLAALAERGEGVAPATDTPGGAAAGAGAAAPPPPRGVGEITSHQDVEKALTKIAEFYKKTEPASPIPLILERAQRLIGKDFVAILKEVAKDGLAQYENITGKKLKD